MAPINLPDGTEVSEIVLPDGSTASEVLAPDGSRVFENPITNSGDLQHHYIAGEETESSGTTIDPFNDQEGSANLIAAGDPTKQTNVVNGQSVARYDGNDGHSSDVTTISQPLQVFIVAKLDNASAAGQTFVDGGDSTNRCKVFADNGSYGLFAGSKAPTGGSTDTNFHIINALFDGGNSSLSIDGNSPIVTSNPGGNSLAVLSIAQRANNSEFIDGNVAEVAVHGSALSSSSVDDWETYLSNKYGIAI